MPDITIRLHRELGERLLGAGPESAKALSALWRQAEDARGRLETGVPTANTSKLKGKIPSF